MSFKWARLGVGVGLRTEHYPHITSQWPEVDWFEAITENYLDTEGRPLHILQSIKSHYPVALHGVSLSIGSSDPLDSQYLQQLQKLTKKIDPVFISDHLCWSSIDGENLHDLLPLPFTKEVVDHVAGRVQKIQDLLERPIMLENVSSYITYQHSTMTEWQFLSEVTEQSDCGILLDVNNIYVNSINHDFDPKKYIDGLPLERIGQIHLGGHTDMGEFLFDTHSKPVHQAVWTLYEYVLGKIGSISTLIEWDADIPTFDQLMKEVVKAKEIMGHINKGKVVG